MITAARMELLTALDLVEPPPGEPLTVEVRESFLRALAEYNGFQLHQEGDLLWCRRWLAPLGEYLTYTARVEREAA